MLNYNIASSISQYYVIEKVKMIVWNRIKCMYDTLFFDSR